MKFKARRKLLKNKRISAFRSKLKRTSLRGGTVTLYEVLFVFFKKVKDDDIIERANAVAYSFTIALFPAILFLFAPHRHMLQLLLRLLDFLHHSYL